MQNKRVINIVKPPFMKDGKIVKGDLTVRNPDGYPIRPETGEIDAEAVKRESLAYFTKVNSAHGSDKATNYTPPKRKRK